MARVAPLLAGVALTGCSHFVVLHDPLTAAERTDLGWVYERDGKLELAEREYRRALRRDPGMTRARVNLGNLMAGAGRWRDAERLYRRAVRDAPEDADALNNLAVALLRQGRGLEEAETCVRRALVLGGERDSIFRSTLSEVLAARASAKGPAR